MVLYPLTAVLETRAGNSTALGVASNAGDLKDGVDNTSNTLSGAKTGSQTVGVLVPGAWAPLQPDVAGNGTDGHGSAVLGLGQSEGQTDSVHVGNVDVVLLGDPEVLGGDEDDGEDAQAKSGDTRGCGNREVLGCDGLCGGLPRGDGGNTELWK